MNKELGKLEVERDPKTGHVTHFTATSEMSEKALMGMLFVLADSLNISLDKFNKSSTRHSNAIIFLTVVLIALAIIQVVPLFQGGP